MKTDLNRILMIIKVVTWSNILLSKQALGSEIDTKPQGQCFVLMFMSKLLKVQIFVLILI